MASARKVAGIAFEVSPLWEIANYREADRRDWRPLEDGAVFARSIDNARERGLGNPLKDLIYT